MQVTCRQDCKGRFTDTALLGGEGNENRFLFHFIFCLMALHIGVRRRMHTLDCSPEKAAREMRLWGNKSSDSYTAEYSDKGAWTCLSGYVPPCLRVGLYNRSHTCKHPSIHTSTLVPLRKGMRIDGCNNLYIFSFQFPFPLLSVQMATNWFLDLGRYVHRSVNNRPMGQI